MNYRFETITAESIADDLDAVRSASPLIHNITNYVVMNLTANALLAIGASPVMADSSKEVEEITAHSDALVLNMGTISGRWSRSMLLSAAIASRLGKPIVLDPVGAGISKYRKSFISQFLQDCKPAVIKGNPSEILAVSSIYGKSVTSHIASKGVDTSVSAEDVLEKAVRMANSIGCTVVITGPEDYITDGTRIARIRNGSVMMARTTGMGCTAAALTGAFLTVSDDYFRSAVSAMAVMGIAGESAARHSSGNGSFQVNFLDELYAMNRDKIRKTLICGE